MAAHAGTIVEEFIPYSFTESYRAASAERRSELREAYVDAYKRTTGAGFAIASFTDVRSHLDDVVVIDVGEDLGQPRDITECSLKTGDIAMRQFYDTIGGKRNE